MTHKRNGIVCDYQTLESTRDYDWLDLDLELEKDHVIVLVVVTWVE